VDVRTAAVTTDVVAVVHPQKSGGRDAAVERLARWAHAAGLSTPHVVTTSADSPGTEQARAAVSSGADLVLAWGGDGTVRSVAQGLTGTGTALGILPAGTGNLLARNLGIPLDLDDAGAVAFGGADRRVDVIEVGLGGQVTTCTVIAGIGLDALLIDASEGLKSVIGPTAYALNTVKALRQKKMRVGVAVDGGAPRWFSARSVLIANVGGLVAGLDAVPEAEVSDGLLHVVVLPLANPVDWARTGVRLALRRAVTDDSRYHLQGSSAWVVAREPAPRQVDGDVLEPGRSIQARVLQGALVVRVPGTRRRADRSG
jgi:diacylglycerol kinase family enzyme